MHASEESPVTQDYKNACVTFSSKDIVLTTKLSGSPCTVINTPYVQQIGTHQSWLEKVLSKNKTLKKWVKMLIYKHGMDQLKKSAFAATYQNVWCAGPTIDFVHEISPVKTIVEKLTAEL